MSSKPNLNAFFDKNKKKTTTTKPAPVAEQQKEDDFVAENKPATKDTKQNKKLDYESSEEEKTDLVIDQGIAVLNKNDVEALKRKRKQEQEDAGSGWSRLENQSKETAFTKSTTAQQKTGLLSGAPVGAKDKSEINFNRQPPKFTNNKNKKRLDEDFPELNAESEQRDEDARSELRSEQASNGMFTSQAKGQQVAREDGQERREGGYERREGGYERREGGYERREGGYERREGGYERREGGYERREGGYERRERVEVREENKDAKKPVFTSSKKKIFTGGDNVDTIQASKQNYDFGKLGLSTASNKVANKDGVREFDESNDDPEMGEKRERKPKREYNEAPSSKPQVQAQVEEPVFANDFEVVQEKRRTRY